ncbi:response regulator transcription factor [Brevibacillus fluminis]|uniref:response regulator transcription factor n=1 Tax=Brevibacillus fluminis TaxID=511487 RepID=UPI003F89B415
MKIRILIADDHTIVRTGLERMIADEEDMEVVGSVADGNAAYEETMRLKPDVVIMDLNMPPGQNGMVATSRIKQKLPDVKILILSMHDDREYVFRVLQAGASGYLLKSSADMDFISAIRTVHRGEAYLYPRATRFLIENFTKEANQHPGEETLYEKLSDREKEVLAYTAQGYANKEIADMLYLSVKTIEANKVKIMEKLQLKTRHELVKYALKHGLLSNEKEI